MNSKFFLNNDEEIDGEYIAEAAWNPVQSVLILINEENDLTRPNVAYVYVAF